MHSSFSFRMFRKSPPSGSVLDSNRGREITWLLLKGEGEAAHKWVQQLYMAFHIILPFLISFYTFAGVIVDYLVSCFKHHPRSDAVIN